MSGCSQTEADGLVARVTLLGGLPHGNAQPHPHHGVDDLRLGERRVLRLPRSLSVSQGKDSPNPGNIRRVQANEAALES